MKRKREERERKSERTRRRERGKTEEERRRESARGEGGKVEEIGRKDGRERKSEMKGPEPAATICANPMCVCMYVLTRTSKHSTRNETDGRLTTRLCA